MPRLRSIQREKYKDLQQEDPVDSDVQRDIIENLRLKADLSNSQNAKLLFRVYLIVLLVVNLLLVMVPYYRKGVNSILSALACVTLFIPIALVYSTVYSVTERIFPFIQNAKTTIYALYIYGLALLIKFGKYTTWKTIQKDVIYLVPLFIGICVLNFYWDNSKIKHAITELDALKYDYKEA